MGEIIVLRIVHVLGGIFWVGSGLFTTFFLGPALSNAGPAAGQVMQGLQARRLFTVLPIVAILTMLSGLRLMWIMSDGFNAAYFRTGMGHTYAAAGGLAIIAFFVSLIMVRPAAARMGALAASGGAPDEMTRLRKRMNVGSAIAVVLLILAATGMAIGRYVG